jgi:LPXTG-motif cell wall-anchored protein
LSEIDNLMEIKTSRNTGLWIAGAILFTGVAVYILRKRKQK